jgi:O-methyltransferase involved in polyketide biosynthesis
MQAQSAKNTSGRFSVQLGRVQETALVPLYARAVESRRKRPFLEDSKAAEIVDTLNWDFQRFGQRWRTQGCCLRSAMFDVWVRDFIARHPGGTVVEIGAGLNTRFERLDNGTIRWFDLELPDMAELRRRFFCDSERRATLAASVVDVEWIETVRRSPGPYFLVAETVFMYMEEAQVKTALEHIASGLPQATIAFDTAAQQAVDRGNRDFIKQGMAVRFTWVCEQPEQIEAWGIGLRLVESQTVVDVPECLWPRLPRGLRGSLWFCRRFLRERMGVYRLNVFAGGAEG